MTYETGHMDIGGDETHRIVTLHGEFDGNDVTRLQPGLNVLLATGPRVIRLEMADVTFADSAFVGFLLGLHGSLTRSGGALAFGEVSPMLTRLLSIAGIDRTLGMAAPD